MTRDAVPPRVLLPSERAEVIEAGIGWMWKDDGIVHLQLRDQIETTLDDAKEMVACFAVINDGQPVRLVTDIGTSKRGSTAAREYFASDECALAHLGVAHIVTSPVARVLMTSWMRIQRPQYPNRVFSPADIAGALDWLRSLERREPAA